MSRGVGQSLGGTPGTGSRNVDLALLDLAYQLLARNVEQTGRRRLVIVGSLKRSQDVFTLRLGQIGPRAGIVGTGRP